MLRYINYDVVFQEIPDETTLVLNISGCPNRCEGCHSPALIDDVGDELDENTLSELMQKYARSITCICFMGGDGAPDYVCRLARFIRSNYDVRIGWYSGRDNFPVDMQVFDYVKLGSYVKSLGGLRDRTTNQRLYKIVTPDNIEDITHKFWK